MDREHLLANAMRIEPPTTADSAPAAVRLSRVREVVIPWVELLEPAQRTLLIGGGQAKSQLGTLQKFDVHWARGGRIKTMGTGEGFHFDRKKELWDFCDCFVDDEVQVANAFVVILPDLGDPRWYAARGTNGAVLTRESFPDETGIWSVLQGARIEGWQLVGDSAQRALATRMSTYTLELSTSDLLEDYGRADALETLGSGLAEWARANRINDADTMRRVWAGEEDVDQLSRRLLWATSLQQRAHARKVEISALAQSRGYVLPLRPITVTRPDNNQSVSYEAGKLYRERIVEVHWEVTEQQTVFVTDRGGCGSTTTRAEQVPVKRPRSAQMYVYDEVALGEDPLDVARERLRTEGFLTFEATDDGGHWALMDGSPLELLLLRCDQDERFRARCALILHRRQSSALGLFARHVSTIIKRPLPGVAASQFPRVFCHESLSYNLAWTGTELGPLVASLNLAPGEERTLNVSRSASQEFSTTATRKALVDESTSLTEDFSTQLERDFSNEYTKGDSSGFKLGLSGSYKAVSGNIGFENSSSTTLKTLAHEISRVARKTAQTFNRRVQSETTVTTAQKSVAQVAEGYTATVRNVNAGRTLNLSFYQINNRFDGGVYLNDLQLCAEGSRELIAGTGIYPRVRVRLHEIERLMPLIAKAELPLLSPLSEPDYWRVLSQTLLDTLEREYEDRDASEVDRAAQMSESSARCLKFGDPRLRVARATFASSDSPEKDAAGTPVTKHETSIRLLEAGDSGDGRASALLLDEAEPARIFERVREFLENVTLLGRPIERTGLIVASGALHLDASVGFNRATEPYAENMREIECARAAAEVEYLQVRNRAIAGAGVENYITDITIGTAEQSKPAIVRLHLQRPVSDLDVYDVMFRGARIDSSRPTVESADGRQLKLEWFGDPPTRADLKKFLALVARGSSRRIFCLDVS